MTGRLIAVVGPSGVGKDSLIEGMIAGWPKLQRVRRVITRPAAAGGEDFEGVSVDRFNKMIAAGAFALHWEAHGLKYGIPTQAYDDVLAGAELIANLSRSKLAEAAEAFPHMHILSVTASPEILAKRLAVRGRESEEDIARRLARRASTPPRGVPLTVIDNSGSLQASVNAALFTLRAGCSTSAAE